MISSIRDVRTAWSSVLICSAGWRCKWVRCVLSSSLVGRVLSYHIFWQLWMRIRVSSRVVGGVSGRSGIGRGSSCRREEKAPRTSGNSCRTPQTLVRFLFFITINQVRTSKETYCINKTKQEKAKHKRTSQEDAETVEHAPLLGGPAVLGCTPSQCTRWGLDSAGCGGGRRVPSPAANKQVPYCRQRKRGGAW